MIYSAYKDKFDELSEPLYQARPQLPSDATLEQISEHYEAVKKFEETVEIDLKNVMKYDERIAELVEDFKEALAVEYLADGLRDSTLEEDMWDRASVTVDDASFFDIEVAYDALAELVNTAYRLGKGNCAGDSNIS